MTVKGKVTCDHIVGIPSVAYALSTCPRCLGKGYYGGISFNSHGKVSEIEKVEVIKQKVEKILTEKKRPTGYGLDYDLLTQINPYSDIYLVKYEIARCLNYLISLQINEKKYGVVYNPSEEIASILNIDTVTDPVDPRVLNVYVSVVSVSGTVVDTTVNLNLR